jgi:hypothetical protein
MLSAVSTNLPCGQKSVPTPSKSIRAGYLSLRADKNRFVRAIFPSVRRNFDLCGHFVVPCEPTSVLCGQKSIRAAIFRSVRAKPPVFEGFGEWRWAKRDSCLVETDARRLRVEGAST